MKFKKYIFDKLILANFFLIRSYRIQKKRINISQKLKVIIKIFLILNIINTNIFIQFIDILFYNKNSKIKENLKSYLTSVNKHIF